jgi:hypothetical protein
MFGYIIWRVIQIVLRVLANAGRHRDDVSSGGPTPKPPQTFKDVQDADFEELPPDEKK